MNTKSILITGARSFAALDLARTFHQAGMRVICVDSMEKVVCRYSKMVNRFYKIASPAFQFEEFVSDLQKIIEREKIDCLIPTCEEVFYIGKAKDQLATLVFASTFEQLEVLHNKWKFYQLLCKLRFTTPETHLWKGEEKPEGKWILKPIYSRFAAQVQVIVETWPKWENSPSNPLIAQAYVDGEKLCSYSICHKGRISAHGVYKVLHSMGIGSAICFQSILAPDVDDFIHRFVAEIDFTGQIAFDFIRGDKLYCLECNPRTTSGIHLFERTKSLADSFFNEVEILRPKSQVIFHEHLFMLWYGIKQKECFSKQFWQHFFTGKNPLWMKGDNRVLAAMPIMLLDAAKRTLFQGQGFHQAMSHDIEYNGESS
ncbi:MAG: ATP-grasp domain-containing protein [Candidatus Rhabdochlamydia sp.]